MKKSRSTTKPKFQPSARKQIKSGAQVVSRNLQHTKTKSRSKRKLSPSACGYACLSEQDYLQANNGIQRLSSAYECDQPQMLQRLARIEKNYAELDEILSTLEAGLLDTDVDLHHQQVAEFPHKPR